MEHAFAAGDPPVGVTADMHAAALAWMPPGFAAFDTGQVDEEVGGDADPTGAPDASAPDAGPAAGAEPAAPAETPADPPKRTSVVESIEAPAVAERRAAALAARANGNAEESDSKIEAGDTAMPADIAGAVEAMNAVPTADGGPRVIVQQVGPANGHDAAPDPLKIPAFLRLVR